MTEIAATYSSPAASPSVAYASPATSPTYITYAGGAWTAYSSPVYSALASSSSRAVDSPAAPYYPSPATSAPYTYGTAFMPAPTETYSPSIATGAASGTGVQVGFVAAAVAVVALFL